MFLRHAGSKCRLSSERLRKPHRLPALNRSILGWFVSRELRRLALTKVLPSYEFHDHFHLACDFLFRYFSEAQAVCSIFFPGHVRKQSIALEPHGCVAGINYLYEGKIDGVSCVLRLTHSSHRSTNMVRGELEWINYFAENGISAAKPIPLTLAVLSYAESFQTDAG